MATRFSDFNPPVDSMTIGKVQLAAKKVVVISESGSLRLIDSGDYIYRNDKVIGRGETVIEFANGSQITLGSGDNVNLTEEVYSPEVIKENINEFSTDQETLLDAQDTLASTALDTQEVIIENISVATPEESDLEEAAFSLEQEQPIKIEDSQSTKETLVDDKTSLDVGYDSELEEKLSIFDLYKKKDQYQGTPAETSVEREFLEAGLNDSVEAERSERYTAFSSEQSQLIRNDILDEDPGFFYTKNTSSNDNFGSSKIGFQRNEGNETTAIVSREAIQNKESFSSRQKNEDISPQAPEQDLAISPTSRILTSSSQVDNEDSFFDFLLDSIVSWFFPPVIPTRARDAEPPVARSRILFDEDPQDEALFSKGFDKKFEKEFEEMDPTNLAEGKEEKHIITEMQLATTLKLDSSEKIDNVRFFDGKAGSVTRLEKSSSVDESSTNNEKAWEFTPPSQESMNIKMQVTLVSGETSCVSYSTSRQTLKALNTNEYPMPDNCLKYEDVLCGDQIQFAETSSSDTKTTSDAEPMSAEIYVSMEKPSFMHDEFNNPDITS